MAEETKSSPVVDYGVAARAWRKLGSRFWIISAILIAIVLAAPSLVRWGRQLVEQQRYLQWQSKLTSFVIPPGQLLCRDNPTRSVGVLEESDAQWTELRPQRFSWPGGGRTWPQVRSSPLLLDRKLPAGSGYGLPVYSILRKRPDGQTRFVVVALSGVPREPLVGNDYWPAQIRFAVVDYQLATWQRGSWLRPLRESILAISLSVGDRLMISSGESDENDPTQFRMHIVLNGDTKEVRIRIRQDESMEFILPDGLKNSESTTLPSNHF